LRAEFLCGCVHDCSVQVSMWVFLVNQFIERFSANSFVCL
jgi:hypothetical protein